MPPRSCSSWRIVCFHEPFSVPTRFSTGTRTSSYQTSQKWRLVVMSSIGRIVMPGESRGTMISEMPAWGGPSFDVRQIR